MDARKIIGFGIIVAILFAGPAAAEQSGRLSGRRGGRVLTSEIMENAQRLFQQGV